MSKIVRASQITLENHKYVLSTDITFRHARIPEQAIDEAGIENWEDMPQSEEDVSQSLLEQAKQEADAIIEDAQQYAQEQIQSAQKDSESIISSAYDQAKQISENARQEGYDTGYAEGRQRAEDETQSMIQQALDTRQEIFNKRDSLIRDAEDEIIHLILDISEKVLQKHVEEDEAVIYDLVKIGLEKCLFNGTIILRVSEEDFDTALGFKNAILVLTENVEDIIIKRDKALRPGSCVLDTQSGSVDSSVWVQYEQIKRSFETLLSERITEYDTESV